MKQYIDGINKFLEYKTIMDKHNIDICLTDNTCDILPEYISDLLPDDVMVKVNTNNMGKKNKGIGLIGQWKTCEELMMNYDYIIHFEPRQLLINFDFINLFLINPCNLFTINCNNPTFNTGLFTLHSNILMDYISNNTMTEFVSIENDLFNWCVDNNIEYNIIDKMNIVWYNNNTKYYW